MIEILPCLVNFKFGKCRFIKIVQVEIVDAFAKVLIYKGDISIRLMRMNCVALEFVWSS